MFEIGIFSFFQGHSGAQCDVVERCESEREIAGYGAVNWPSTFVNASAAVPCPYNADEAQLERRCTWDREARAARWQDVSANDVCKKQSAILVHLGVLANYISVRFAGFMWAICLKRRALRLQRPDTTASGFAAVQRFLASVLRFPAFDLNVTSVQFDERIAEHVSHVSVVVRGEKRARAFLTVS